MKNLLAYLLAFLGMLIWFCTGYVKASIAMLILSVIVSAIQILARNNT